MMVRSMLYPLWLAMLRICLAQSITTGSITPTSSAAAKATHSIAVGAAGLSFTPTVVLADVGDIIEFRFYPLNHSVAQAEFKYPCIPYEDTGPNKVGFWSGFHPLSVVLQNPPIFQVRINSTDPVFFYCAAPGACIEDGMIGVINPNATQSFETQLAFAHNSTLAFSPGEYFPAEGIATTTAKPLSTSSILASSTAITTSSASASPTATPAVASSGSTGLSTGAIAGISVGGAVVAILAAALMYLCGRHRTIKEVLRQSQINTEAAYRPNSGQMSPIYESGFSGKAPIVDIQSISGGRYSTFGTPGYNDRSQTNETESHGSRSPPIMPWSAADRNLMDSSFGGPIPETAPDAGISAQQRSEVSRTSQIGRHFSRGRGPHELAVVQDTSDEALSPASLPFSFAENDEGQFRGYGQQQD